MILAILVYPVALTVSAGLAGLGYIFGIVSIVIAAYLIARRATLLPLVLGIVLLILTLPIMVGTMIVHMSVLTVAETVKAGAKILQNMTKVKVLKSQIGSPVRVGDWEIMVSNVRMSHYIVKDDMYYRSKPGHKLVLVTLRVSNIGETTKNLPEIWNFILITDANKSYESAQLFQLEYLPDWELTDEIKSEAIRYDEFSTLTLAPGTHVEGDIVFQIPENEEPAKIVFRVGIVGGYEVTIDLR